MARIHLTDKLLRGLEATGSRADLWDAVVPGLVARVSQTGAKTFVLSYRMGGRNTTKQRLTLGAFPTMSLADARARAKVVLGQIAGGVDPRASRVQEVVAEEPSEVLTFGQLAEDYLRLHPKMGTRWWLEQKRVVERELLPAWGSMAASALRRKDIAALLQAIAVRPAPVQANRTRAILSGIFNFGIGQDLLEVNPVTSTKKPFQEIARERVLTEEELVRAWSTFGELTPSLGLHLRFKMFTLQRGGEIRTIARLHVSKDWWTIPRDLTKMKRREHRVPLVPSALELLEQAAEECGGNQLYFASPRDSNRPVDVGAPAQACKRLCKRHGLLPFTPHDLRRTAATALAGLGVDELLIARLLSHSTDAGTRRVPTVTGIYNRYAYDAEKREALLSWEKKLLSILAAPQEGK